MIHVHGGSVVLAKLRAAGIPGEGLEWTDVLCQGPTPAGVSDAAWLDLRAAFLDAEYGGDGGRSARLRLAAQDAALARAVAGGEEIVLWFSADWFCQAILVCLVARLGTLDGRLALVSLGGWPGVDDGRSCTLAFLSPGQLHQALAQREPVTATLAAQARQAWDALRAPDPRALIGAADGALPTLPFAREGLRRHLEEFPAAGNGLSRTERQLLEALEAEPAALGALFPRIAGRETRLWLTDTIVAATAHRLASGSTPLLQATGELHPAPTALAARVSLTAAGRAVLAGDADWVATAGLDRWVGGVHLRPGNVWRWNAGRGALVAPA